MANKRQNKKNIKKLDRLASEIGEKAVTHTTKQITKKLGKAVEASVKSSSKVRGNVKAHMTKDSARIVASLSVTEEAEKVTTGPGLVDMKKVFSMSSQRKMVKRWNPQRQQHVQGWYIDVPIRRKTYRSAKKDFSGYMTSGLYNALRDQDYGKITVDKDLLYTARNKKLSNTIPELNYEPTTGDINKIENPERANTSMYVAIRRVSNLSAPNSWLINRKTAKEEDPEVQRIIQEMRDFRI